MPIQSSRTETADLRVMPSAALELMWVLHNGAADHELGGRFTTTEPVRVKYGAAIRSFWPDKVRGFTELVVLAERSETLLDPDIRGFFAAFERGAGSRAAETHDFFAGARTPSLLSETPAERVAVANRLEALRADAGVRARYLGLLKDVWEAVRVEWEQTGRAAVIAATRQWQKQLAEGTPYRDLLQRTRLWPGRPDLEEMADADAAGGRMVLTPGWFFGDIHIVEIDGSMYLGRGILPHGDLADQRQTARHVSKTL